MSRNGYRGPKLPKALLDQVQKDNGSKSRGANVSRKDKRKAERQQKKFQQQRPKVAAQKRYSRQEEDEQDVEDIEEGFEESESEAPPPPKPAKGTKPLKSILKKDTTAPVVKPAASESDTEIEKDSPVISKTIKKRLQDDDDEIAALEKKLGIKGKKSKVLEQDGLDWLMDGSDGSDEEGSSLKRKRPEDDDWLRDKRLKASGANEAEDNGSSEGSGDDIDGADDDGEDLENPFSEDELDSDDFGCFGSEDDGDTEVQPQPKKRKENPYVPPVAKSALPTTKYVPPSLRAPASSDEEILKQLRRQVQGLLNRLSESNMISILQSLEELYSQNARQHVTSTLIDLLVGLVADAAILNDPFLILHAGFTAAVYKVQGTDFAAQLLERVVEEFDENWSVTGQDGKQALNLLAFLCNLYTFQVVGSAIIFDYVRLLLDELSENNTELLLRVIRTCGQSLRQDDPSALKDIVLLLQRSVAKVGEENVSVRTKFMIETINDLKNNRMKTAISSNLATEQTNRMKKTLSSLSTSRSVKSREPLSITLADIRDSEKKGRWWLIGASYHDPAKLDTNNGPAITNKTAHADPDAGYESETPGSVNLSKLARTQGMNTQVRRAIFTTLMSSTDYTEAHTRILKLHLKNKQMLELPRVLVHCVGAEDAYNPYYALVAAKFCGDKKLRDVRKGFEFTLWDFFRKMQGDGNDDEGETVDIRKIVNLAKFYGTLIADSGISVRVLKKLDLTYLESGPSTFVEVLLTTVMVQAKKKQSKDGEFGNAVRTVFMQTAGDHDLVQGLRYLIEETVARAELANGKKETRAIESGCRVASQALEEAGKAAPIIEDDDDSEEDL